MARSKKTIDVLQMLLYANAQLARKDDTATMHFKMGICVMIERILYDTKNYGGFQYIDPTDSQPETPGAWNRQYYISQTLLNHVPISSN